MMISPEEQEALNTVVSAANGSGVVAEEVWQHIPQSMRDAMSCSICGSVAHKENVDRNFELWCPGYSGITLPREIEIK